MTETATETFEQRAWRETLDKIRDIVREINDAAGVGWSPETGDNRIVTFGYIGNLGRFGDDRSWTVWVKGPNAFNGPSNAVPYFRSGDVPGAARALTFLQGFRAAQTTTPWRP